MLAFLLSMSRADGGDPNLPCLNTLQNQGQLRPLDRRTLWRAGALYDAAAPMDGAVVEVPETHLQVEALGRSSRCLL